MHTDKGQPDRGATVQEVAEFIKRYGVCLCDLSMEEVVLPFVCVCVYVCVYVCVWCCYQMLQLTTLCHTRCYSSSTRSCTMA